MELVGDEKRIQALFRELKLEDERIAPRFAAVWSRAQSKNIRPRIVFNLAFATSTVLLFCVLFSLAWWSRYWQRSQQPNAMATVPSNLNVGPTQIIKNPTRNQPLSGEQHHRSSSKEPAVRFAVHRQAALLTARRSQIRNAAAISNWASPTTALLRSPGDEVLTSLPQLNESANELKSFLPRRDNWKEE